MAAVMSGCAMSPQDADKALVKAAFESSTPFEELYHQLTTPATGELLCDQVYRSAIYPERGEFRVYYGIQSGGLAHTIALVHSVVYGFRSDNGTRIEIRNAQEPAFGTQRVPALTNFIETGRCE
ncbi:hypothetical protein PS273GM_07015 [Stutzerimonas stutzeri]|uniref:Uncharacterized protein n=2 Tax=Stutzerimonas stutzeri TaxID=316 RepID=A0A172WNQ1_STUST|nr:hypothetical protein PS273GM_07015 [Stutzerimonas stutzeri]